MAKQTIIYIGIRHTRPSSAIAQEQTVGTFTKKSALATFLGVHPNTITRWIKNKDYDHGDKSIIVTIPNDNENANGE